MRHIYALFRACDRYGNDRLERACERAVDAEATSVKVVIAMVERALEADAATAEAAVPDNVIVGRFARDPGHFSTGREVLKP